MAAAMSKRPHLQLAAGAHWPTNAQLLDGLEAVGARLAAEQKRPDLKIRIVSGLRTRAEQERLYAAYLNGTGNLAAVPGTSRHETGNAADCGVVLYGYTSLCEFPGAVAALRANRLAATVYSEPWHIEAGGSHRWPSRIPKHPTVRRGDRGPAVARVQAAIGITPDGAFGTATGKAVRRFQREHGLPADGVVGPATWTQILKAER